MSISDMVMDADFLVDPLKRAKHDLLQRQIRREDLGMAIAERQLIREEEHREKIAQVISSVVTFMDTLPDRLERTLSLPGPMVNLLRTAIDAERDNLHAVLMEAEAVGRGRKHVQVALQNLAAKPVDSNNSVKAPRKRKRLTNAERAAQAIADA